jgi:hypothetical protein
MNRKITSVIIAMATIIAVGAAAMTVNGYDSVYASSSGTSGSVYNVGPDHTKCTAIASGANCNYFQDNGKHTGLN